eukprot:Awhi_evm1s2438
METTLTPVRSNDVDMDSHPLPTQLSQANTAKNSILDCSKGKILYNITTVTQCATLGRYT